MATFCKRGHEHSVHLKRGWKVCRLCTAESNRKVRAKKVAAGRWWEYHTTKSLSASELKMFASRLARGASILEITAGTAKTKKRNGLYHRWIAFKHLHPEIGKRFRRLAIDNKYERFRAANRERRQLASAPWVLTPPPSDMWAIIDAVVPRRLFSELRMEIRQQLALDVLERRCECTAAGLSHALAVHWHEYYREYANRWGDVSLDGQLFEDSHKTLGDTLKRRLWD
jgi:hypothetical protein